MWPLEMPVNDRDTLSVARRDGGVVLAMKKALESKFTRNLKKRSNQKDSSTRRNFDYALHLGELPLLMMQQLK